MKRLIPVLCALAAAGCITETRPVRGNAAMEKPTETSAEREQREIAYLSFKRMHQAWIDGDAVASLSLMSVRYVSDWMLYRTRDTSDPDWPKMLAKLDKVTRVEFDLWVRDNKNVKIPISNSRAAPLPETVLISVWLRDTWKHYFDLEKANLKLIAEAINVGVDDCGVDGTGCSIQVRIRKAPTHIYQMVIEGDAWKLDYVVKATERRSG
ncbi:MAG TPA: hypothetical protein VFS19_03595 [Planctomycetota bacterium]|nr:hypothetical protein [Planctomycetota bacterium]